MDNRIFFLLTKTENAMNMYIKQQFAKAGVRVTPGQLGILFLLKGKNGQTMTELSHLLGTDNSAVTRAVDRLEKNGFVERNNSENDRREYRITITETGIAETVMVKRVIATINKKIENEFPAGELDEFKKTLVKMHSIFRS